MKPLDLVEDAPTAVSTLAPAATSLPCLPTAPARILIVDDQPVFRCAARMLLEARREDEGRSLGELRTALRALATSW